MMKMEDFHKLTKWNNKLIIDWIFQSCDMITQQNIQKSFQGCGYVVPITFQKNNL